MCGTMAPTYSYTTPRHTTAHHVTPRQVMGSKGTIGIDIGGTLAKLALAIPDGADAPALPEKFGFSG